jgi:hypothetical protein
MQAFAPVLLAYDSDSFKKMRQLRHTAEIEAWEEEEENDNNQQQ